MIHEVLLTVLLIISSDEIVLKSYSGLIIFDWDFFSIGHGILWYFTDTYTHTHSNICNIERVMMYLLIFVIMSVIYFLCSHSWKCMCVYQGEMFVLYEIGSDYNYYAQCPCLGIHKVSIKGKGLKEPCNANFHLLPLLCTQIWTK